MILGMGTDIVELDRLEEAIKRGGEAFLKRVYTADELAEARAHREYLGGRWAAKEAAAKALGCGIGGECSFSDIEVIDASSGAPEIKCRAAAAIRLAERHGGLRWHVSISHERAYAVATVIVESAEKSL